MAVIVMVSAIFAAMLRLVGLGSGDPRPVA
jgi:hypothetical protein